MRGSGLSENTTRGIIVLVVIFLLLIGGIIVFSRFLITNIATANPAANTLALLVAATLPLLLFGIVIFQISRLLRQRAQGRAGARLKMRITIFFIFISLLSAAPQAMLAITFINSAMGTWFSASIGDALKGASRISIDYYREKVENLGSFGDGPRAPALVGEFAAAPDRAWRAIRSLNAGIDAVQLFTAAGREAAFRGDARARLAGAPAAGTRGIQPREDQGEVSILRDVKPLTMEGGRWVAVFSTLVSKELDRSARKITESLTVFNQVDRYRELFQIVLIAFFFLFSLPIFFITVLVSLLLTERIIGPIVSLEEATLRVAEGDFSFRILTRPRDELANLVDSFNGMIAELDHSRKKLLQAERITAWQEIAQRLAHEIRNPLTPIKLSAQRILRRHASAAAEGAAAVEGDGEREGFGKVLAGSVSAIIQEVENLEKLLREFGDFAKLPVPQPAPTGLRDLLAEVASVYANLSGTVEIDISDVSPAFVLSVDRAQMKQVFANLFTNAIHAMPSGGRLAVRADGVRKGHGSWCRVAVSDTGSGIPADEVGRIFDPYFTTKKEGTGLGLAIVQRIVFDHHGDVWVESTSGAGTTFFIDLPMGTEQWRAS
jgi:two-component system, NtrC family, nitrogen regulation sensor histidine kinase NtrY